MPILPLEHPESLAATLGVMLYAGEDDASQKRARAARNLRQAKLRLKPGPASRTSRTPPARKLDKRRIRELATCPRLLGPRDGTTRSARGRRGPRRHALHDPDQPAARGRVARPLRRPHRGRRDLRLDPPQGPPDRATRTVPTRGGSPEEVKDRPASPPTPFTMSETGDHNQAKRPFTLSETRTPRKKPGETQTRVGSWIDLRGAGQEVHSPEINPPRAALHPLLEPGEPSLRAGLPSLGRPTLCSRERSDSALAPPPSDPDRRASNA